MRWKLNEIIQIECVSRLLDSCSDQTQTHTHTPKQSKTKKYKTKHGDLNGGETNILATRIDVESPMNRPIMVHAPFCIAGFFSICYDHIEFFTMVSK